MSPPPLPAATLSQLRLAPDGLIAAIVQQAEATSNGGVPRGRVLMMAWMNQEALELTLATRRMHYWSRSRGKLWLKGERSGHFQAVVSWHRDCDGDALLFIVRQDTGACHTGYESCFFQEMDFAGNPLPVAEGKRFDAGAVYSS